MTTGHKPHYISDQNGLKPYFLKLHIPTKEAPHPHPMRDHTPVLVRPLFTLSLTAKPAQILIKVD